MLMHHVVRKGHRSLRVLRRRCHNVIVTVSSGATLNFTRVAVPETIVVHVHQVGLENHFEDLFEFGRVIARDLELEVFELLFLYGCFLCFLVILRFTIRLILSRVLLRYLLLLSLSAAATAFL